MMNMSNPRQITPTGGSSPNCAVGWPQDTALNAATATFPRLDPSQPACDLVHPARKLHLEATATMNREWRKAYEDAQDYANAPLPWAMTNPESLTVEAMEQVDRAIAAGERSGYLKALEDVARDLFPLVLRAGYAEGQKDLAVGQDAAHRQWQEEMHCRLSASLAQGVPYAELCEIRGEHDRAARARQVLAERGIA